MVMSCNHALRVSSLAVAIAAGLVAVMAFPGPSLGAEPKPKFFVVHCTAIDTNPLGQVQDEAFFESYFQRKQRQGSRNRGHGMLMPSGTFRQWWPFEKRDVWATRTETCSGTSPKTFGTFINIEVAYDCGRRPSPAPTAAQYKGLADVYAQVHALYGPLTIVSHKEVDRGIKGAHTDPYNFDFPAFYSELERLGLDMSKIKRISSARHALPSGSIYSHVAPPRLDSPLVLENSRPDDCKRRPGQ